MHDPQLKAAFEAAVALQSATSVPELESLAGKAFREIGFDWYAAAVFFSAGREPNVKLIHGEFQSDWARRYQARNYSQSSCIAREMLLTAQPYSWSEVIERRGLSGAQNKIWSEARDFGLKDGLFIPSRWVDGSYSSVVLADRNPPVADPFVRTMAGVIAAAYLLQLRKIAAPPRRHTLTVRQIECLSWVALGKSSADIAEILGVSAATVDEHVADACRKLGVRTRIQAAVQAALSGLLSWH